MSRKISNVWSLFRQTISDWLDDRAPEQGAALAFYSALSMAPLLVLLLRLLGALFDEGAARAEIERQVQSLVGRDGAEAVQAMMDGGKTGAGATTILSLATLLLGASGVFGQLQQSLNTIWEVQPKPGRGIWGFVRNRFLSFAMVMGIAFLLLVSLVISAGLAFLGTYLERLPPGLQFLSGLINFVVSAGTITVLFALMFKVLPDVKMSWRDVWLGAFVTALLFSVGKAGIGLYLGHSAMTDSYGAAGSLVVLLVWVYYSAQILLFGAELTQVYANQYGSRIVPAANAESTVTGGNADRSIPDPDPTR